MKVEIIGGPQDNGRVFSFDEPAEIVIGRSRGCALTLNDPELSRNHARIVLATAEAVLEDLNSKNGTFLNGRTVFKARLSEGDEILIGGTLLRVSELPASGSSETARFREGSSTSRILLSLSQGDADILSRRMPSVSHAELEHENRVLREICRISQILASKTDPQTILCTVLNEMKHLLGADTVCLLTRAADTDAWNVLAAAEESGGAADVPVSRTLIRQALEEGRSILSADPVTDGRTSESAGISPSEVSFAMCSPVRIGERFGGVLFLDRRSRREAFNQMDLRLAASAANIMGIFLEKEEYEASARGKARLAAMGEVMASLAHYIKNVITGFRLTLATLRAAISQQRADKADQYLDMLSEQERHISNLMLNMLSYVKEREPSRTWIEAKDLVRGVVEPFRSKLDKEKIRFDLICADSAGRIYADEMAMHRILLNLLLNSFDALESKKNGGEKLIRIQIDPIQDPPGVEFRFHDTGVGIPEEKRNKIFSAFYSTKGSRGTGLGLAVVAKLIQEHSGQLEVLSRVNEWTEFRLTIHWNPQDLDALQNANSTNHYQKREKDD